MTAPQEKPVSPFAAHLPAVSGKYRFNVMTGKTVWFRVGGPADIVFKPAGAGDIAAFFRGYDNVLPVFTAGAGSNLLIRDGGIRALVIRLGRGFTDVTPDAAGGRMYAGAAALAPNAAALAAAAGLSGAEFMAGIPGTVGGLVAMNAGAYGSEIADILDYADIVTPAGEMLRVPAAEAGFRYRGSAFPEGSVVTGASFRLTPADTLSVKQRIAGIMEQRSLSQPVKGKTGGSTFKNPPGEKAWELIDRAGCRGMRSGGAQISEKHCNFMLNLGEATAADLENLGESVREKVLQDSGVTLEWEIKRVGERA